MAFTHYFYRYPGISLPRISLPISLPPCRVDSLFRYLTAIRFFSPNLNENQLDIDITHHKTITRTR